jgi:hypothetical protein
VKLQLPSNPEHITDATLRQLSHHYKLAHLNLGHNTSLSTAGLKFISHLKLMTEIKFKGMSLLSHFQISIKKSVSDNVCVVSCMRVSEFETKNGSLHYSFSRFESNRSNNGNQNLIEMDKSSTISVVSDSKQRNMQISYDVDKVGVSLL